MNDIAAALLVLFVGFALGAIFGGGIVAEGDEKSCRLTNTIRFNDVVYTCNPKP